MPRPVADQMFGDFQIAAQAWKYGVGGALKGKGVQDTYMGDVENLYETQ